MKYLNVKTGCIEETTNKLVIEQFNKYPELYKPVKDVKVKPKPTTKKEG
jgi:hypothetical protein